MNTNSLQSVNSTKTIIFCMGAPRSGLNLLLQCFQTMGFTQLSRRGYSDPATINNLLLQDLNIGPMMALPMPSGWMESDAASKARDRIKALFADEQKMTLPLYISDYVLCRTFPLWLKMCDEMDVKTTRIHILRHPWEVAQSIATTEQIDISRAHVLWLSYIREVQRHLDVQPAKVIFFDQLLADPITSLSFLKHKPNTALLNVVQPSLKKHHIASLPESGKTNFKSFDYLYQQFRFNNFSQKIKKNHLKKNDNRNKSQRTYPASTETEVVDTLINVIGLQEKGSKQDSEKKETLFLSFFLQQSKKINHVIKTISLAENGWQKINFNLSLLEKFKVKSIDISPLNSNGIAFITGLIFVHGVTKETLYEYSFSEYKSIQMQGAIRIPDIDLFAVLITQKDSSLTIPYPVGFNPNHPVCLEFWIKVTTKQDIIQSINSDNIEVLLPTYYIDNKEQIDGLAKTAFVNQKDFLSFFKKNLFGGVSICVYYSKNKLLSINGWYLPVNNYDSIEVFDKDNKLLGEATYNQRRFDVLEHYPEFNEQNSGWFFTKIIADFHTISKIKIILKQNGQILKSSSIEPSVDMSNVDKKEFMFENEIKSIDGYNYYFENDILKDLKDYLDIKIKHGTDDVVRLLIKSSKSELKILDQSLDELYEHIQIELDFGDNIKRIISSSNTKNPIVDLKIIDEICSYANEKDKNFYRKYMIGNYFRIFSDCQILKKILPISSKILDIGSIPPLLPALLKKKKFKDISVIDPNAANLYQYFIKKEMKYFEGNILNTYNQSNNKYDAVIFCEVIEHLSGDLIESINNVASYLRKDGYLFVTTPNSHSFSGFFGLSCYESGLASKYNDTVKMQYDRYKEHGYFGHLREFTEKEVIDLFSDLGFKYIQSFFQEDYRTRNDKISKIIFLLENMFPRYRLFGKYLFKKIN